MSDAHLFDPTILREYDIRGTVGETLNAADATAIGRAFGTIVAEAGGGAVCVGYDGRLSSPELEAALVEGLTAAGVDAWRIGLGPTPMLYFATRKLEAAGGIMITGSHNPPDQNGFKMMLGKKPFYGEQIQEIGRIAAEGDFVDGKGGEETVAVVEPYLDELIKAYA
ncbi:MAG: phosphomannomutase, partial [Alphaproteobacteria bacterium]|nr:phosphomannomutase [Alphaproteobacteria bacterium]